MSIVKIALIMDLALFIFMLVMSFDLPDQLPSIPTPVGTRLIPGAMLIINAAAAYSVFVP